MKRLAKRGFTLVEIMIVVAIIALLAAIAIPNVLRGRVTANESAAIGNLRALISSLEMYRSVYSAYPPAAANWVQNMYTDPNPDFGPPSFNIAMNNNIVQGFEYLYTPVGATPIQQYSIRARPSNLNQTGTRTFFTTEAGTVFHCNGNSSTTTVPANTIDLAPSATCP